LPWRFQETDLAERADFALNPQVQAALGEIQKTVRDAGLSEEGET
jgi:hypothetical protein